MAIKKLVSSHGIVCLNAKEIKAIKVLILHTRRDIGWRASGSFTKAPKDPTDPDFVFDEREANLAELGIDLLEALINQRVE